LPAPKLAAYASVDTVGIEHPIVAWKPTNPYGKPSRNLTERAFPLAGTQIKLSQNSDLQQQKVGEVVWDASYLLAKYIESHVPVSGKRVVELGAGCGLVGLTVGLLGGDVTITDRERELEMARRNIRLNQPLLEARPVTTGKINTMMLQWGTSESVQELAPPVDLIVGADVLYYSKAFPLLLQTLKALSGPSTVILICNQWRDLAEHKFIAMAKELFNIRRVPNGHLDQDIVQYQEIRIYRMKLLNNNTTGDGEL